MGSLSILFRQCSYPVILKKILTELQVHHSSFSFSSPVDLPQAFGVDHILILVQMLSHAGASHNCSSLSILIRSAQDISEDSCFHSQSVQAIWRLLSHSSHLILPVQYLFQSIVQRCILLVGPNPQVFFQDLTWLSQLSRSYSQIHCKVWRKNELSSVKCLSPRSFKLFSLLVQSF